MSQHICCDLCFGHIWTLTLNIYRCAGKHRPISATDWSFNCHSGGILILKIQNPAVVENGYTHSRLSCVVIITRNMKGNAFSVLFCFFYVAFWSAVTVVNGSHSIYSVEKFISLCGTRSKGSKMLIFILPDCVQICRFWWSLREFDLFFSVFRILLRLQKERLLQTDYYY